MRTPESAETEQATRNVHSARLMDRFEQLEGPLREVGAEQLAGELYDAAAIMREQYDEIARLRTSLSRMEMDAADMRKVLRAILDGVEPDCGEPDCPDCGPWREARRLSIK